MGWVGDADDNAVAEPRFAPLKVELLHRQEWASRGTARSALLQSIEAWHQPRRRRSTCGYRSPAQSEQHHRHAGRTAA
jgi:hypothetical protein